MRLQRIKLDGFLGHQTECELDFSEANLWLVHGANGSGKSSFWDALMYAFFKKTRGGINLTDLIHDREAKANIFVEFVLNGQIFQICCEIKRRGRNNRFVQTKNGNGWRTIEDGDREVNDWVKKELQISPETFTSAVLLQQGKADAFFTVESSKRKEVLLELLNLKFYRELGKLAAKRKSDFDKDRKRLEIERESLPNPSAEDLKIQEELIEDEKGLLKILDERFKNKETELRNARNAAEWQVKINNIESEQNQIAELVKKSAQIETKARRFLELERVLSPLEDFWCDHEKIEKKNSELAQFTEVLQRRENIERDFKRYEILHENLPKLHQLKKDTKDLSEAQGKRDETELNLKDLKSKIEESRKEVAESKVAFDEKESEKQSIQENLTEFDKQIHSKQQMLETRNQTTGAAECAFCGSELETEKAKARLAHKHEIWEKEITKLGTEKEIFTQKFLEIERESKKAKAAWENAKSGFHQADKELTGVLTKFNFEKKEVEKCEGNLQENLAKAGDWSKALGNLENLVKEFDDLKNSPSANEELKKALTEESKAKGVVLLLNEQIIEHRKKIPSFFLSACENKAELEEIRNQKTELQNAESEAENLSKARDRQNVLDGELNTWREQLEAISSEHRRSVAEVETELKEINKKIETQKQTVIAAENELGKLQNQQERYAKKEAEFKKIAREFELWEKLAKALGKGKDGLESVLVRKAQEQIKLGANDILRRLSKMRFEIDLRDISENELEIRVQDNQTNSSRPFENFSGGEKFCVAVSLALAIGQTANKGRTAQTLIIDEGFGALDEENRSSLVEEFRRLSTDILQGGCVIAVSHQDDVCEAFMNRYHLGKNEGDFIEVRRN